MNRQWKPGDVAMYEYLSSGRLIALRVRGGNSTAGGDCPNDMHSVEDHWHLSNGGWTRGTTESIQRPLVLIDPEDRVQAERLARLLFEALCKVGGDWESGVEYELRAHMRDALQEFAKPEPVGSVVAEERPIVHAVMYRNYKIGSLCNSGAWGPATLFSMVTDAVTCPGCRTKLDGVPPMGATS